MARSLAALVLLALAARVLAAAQERVVHKDSLKYQRMARLIEAGDWDGALTVFPPFPALYPMQIAALHRLGLPWDLAGRIPSILWGALGVIPLAALAAAAWNLRVGVVAGVLYAVSPELARLGGWIMSEGPFLFFFLSAMALTYFAVERPSWRMGLLAGIAAAAAYHSRPEGIYAVLGLAGWPLLRGPRRWRALAAGGLGLAAAFLLMLPYLVWVHDHTGRWRAFATDLPDQLMGFYTEGTAPEDYDPDHVDREERARDEWGRAGATALLLGDAVLRMNFYVLVPLFAVGAWRLRRGLSSTPGAAVLALYGFGYLLPPVLYLFAGAEFARRYTLPAFVILYPFAAVGALALWDAARPRWPRLAAAVAILCLCAAVGKVAHPVRDEFVDVRHAGERILAIAGPGRVVMSFDLRVEFYCEGRHAPLPVNRDVADAALDRERPDWIVVGRESPLAPVLRARYRSVEFAGRLELLRSP